jgi:hypothetical protein
MAGTVKLCVPELVFVEELVVCGELFGCAEAVAVTEGVALRACVAESAGVGDDAGVLVSADVGDAPGVEAKAAADPLGAAAEGFDPLAPHALRPAPQMTAAMITAGTRHILMLLPSGK